MSWPSLASEPEMVRELALRGSTRLDGLTPVECPTCGHERAATDVRDLRGLPGTVIRPGGSGPAQDVDWACGGCFGRVARSNLNPWLKSQLFRALGAPSKAVKLQRARELVAERTPKDRPYNPADMLDDALAELPDEDIPSTRAPVG